ncbi:MAG: FliH/SctL family protein [Brevinema sp.]
MSQQAFDPHAKILHRGQYAIKESPKLTVPIKSFDGNNVGEDEQNSYQRIDEMNQQILELDRQIQTKRKAAEEQGELILAQARDDAQKIIEESEQNAFDKVQQSIEEKDTILQKANEEAARLIDDAERESQRIISSAKNEATDLKQQAEKEGRQTGYDDGLENGKADIAYVVDRLHTVVAETSRERERILIHSENQVIDLVLTMVGKVVKRLSVEDQDVVVENIKAAMELLRGALTIFIHVSPKDFNYVVSFKDHLVGMIENRAELKFLEDPSLEPGGVYIESENGDIDATIRSQLEALETQMRFYMPLKVKSPAELSREKMREEKKEAQKMDELRKKDVPKTTFAQREEYISDPLNSYSTKNGLETPEPTPEPEPTKFQDEFTEDPIVHEAMESYKTNSEDNDQDAHDEDITI